MTDILTSINTRETPQRQPARSDQVKNAAGGYVFQVGDVERLHRFLTLGTDGNTFYTKAAELTRANAEVVFRMAATDHDTLLREILAISEAGRAPKNKQAIFALAIACSTDDSVKNGHALAVMHKVCRTFEHLAQFNVYLLQFRGRGRAVNRALANWYLKKPVGKVAYQVAKYRERHGYSHAGMLRLSKAGQFGMTRRDNPADPARFALFEYITKGTLPQYRPDVGEWTDAMAGYDSGLAIIEDFEDAKRATTKTEWVKIINRGHGMSHEMLPDAAKEHGEVWEALVVNGMPQGALIRNLGKMTNAFGNSRSWVAPVVAQLANTERLTKGRVHPINVLIAMRTYAQGHSEKGRLTWNVIPDVVDGLDRAFYGAYGSVEATGKRRLLALDISGSMSQVRWGQPNLIAGLPITPREAAAAVALVTLNAETPGMTDIIGFSGTGRAWSGYSLGSRGQRIAFANSGHGEPIRLDITARRRLDDVCTYTANLPYGDTDCALPFVWAQRHGLDFDSVEILTDNESWSGPIHAHQAAERYRNHVGHDVKFVAVAMTATSYSVVDPKDPSGLNVSGFDAAVPNLVGDFVAGRL